MPAWVGILRGWEYDRLSSMLSMDSGNVCDTRVESINEGAGCQGYEEGARGRRWSRGGAKEKRRLRPWQSAIFFVWVEGINEGAGWVGSRYCESKLARRDSE